MSKPELEADARIVIDAQLRQAGCEPADRAQVRTEVAVPLGRKTAPMNRPARPWPWPSELPRTAYSEDQDTWHTDYLLHDRDGRLLAAVESKRNAIDPYTCKTEAIPAANELQALLILLCNGERVDFWNYESGEARLKNDFFSQRDLARIYHRREEVETLASIAVPETYLHQDEVRLVRPFPKGCMSALDHALGLGKRRFPIEQPTGTGKTDIICLWRSRSIHCQQIRGRGTRTAPHIGKQQFVDYDFFRNHQYFTDGGTNITWTGGAGGGSGTSLPPKPRELFGPLLSIYAAADKDIKLFGEEGLKDVIAEMDQTIFTTSA